MKRLIARFAGVFFMLILPGLVGAEAQKQTPIKEDRLNGTVHTIDKDASAIIVRKGAVQHRIVYNAETKFTIQNRPASIDDVIVGRQVTCVGSFNDQAQLLATRVEIRSK